MQLSKWKNLSAHDRGGMSVLSWMGSDSDLEKPTQRTSCTTGGHPEPSVIKTLKKMFFCLFRMGKRTCFFNRLVLSFWFAYIFLLISFINEKKWKAQITFECKCNSGFPPSYNSKSIKICQWTFYNKLFNFWVHTPKFGQNLGKCLLF